MPNVHRLAIAATLAAATSACIAPPAADAPIRSIGISFTSAPEGPPPSYGNPVNPTPVRGYRVRCDSLPDLAYELTGAFNTDCGAIVPAAGHGRVVVRAKG